MYRFNFTGATLVAICCLLAVTCRQNDKKSVGPTSASFNFTDYAHVDTSGYVVIKTSIDDLHPRPELYLWWEKNFGEPFTDMNGNGLYDRGTDIFIMSSNPEVNHDLNHNGQYDGPNDLWEPEIPFDDIDGNQTRRCEQPYSPLYHDGVPFCDLNDNGVWDLTPPFAYELIHFFAVVVDSSTVQYRWLRPDTLYSFTSDSGVPYLILSDSDGMENSCQLGSFLVSDPVIAYALGDMGSLPVLLSTDVGEATDTVTAQWGNLGSYPDWTPGTRRCDGRFLLVNRSSLARIQSLIC